MKLNSYYKYIEFLRFLFPALWGEKILAKLISANTLLVSETRKASGSERACPRDFYRFFA